VTRPPADVTVDHTTASLSTLLGNAALPGNVTSRGHLSRRAAAVADRLVPSLPAEDGVEYGRRRCVLTMLSRAARSDTLLLGLSEALRSRGSCGLDIEIIAVLVRSGTIVISPAAVPIVCVQKIVTTLFHGGRVHSLVPMSIYYRFLVNKSCVCSLAYRGFYKERGSHGCIGIF